MDRLRKTPLDERGRWFLEYLRIVVNKFILIVAKVAARATKGGDAVPERSNYECSAANPRGGSSNLFGGGAVEAAMIRGSYGEPELTNVKGHRTATPAA